MNSLFVWLTSAFGALLGLAIGDALSEEVRGRLDQFPRTLICLAAARLPQEQREDHTDEWLAELHEILRGSEALPVTRVIIGTRYALGLLRAGRKIGREAASNRVVTDGSVEQFDLASAHGEAATTSALLDAARMGEQSAWDELVDRYARLVWAVGRGLGLRSEPAADCCQGTWLQLVENLARVNGDQLGGWLGVTMRHECEQLLQTDPAALADADGSTPVTSDAEQPDEYARLGNALARLCARDRLVLRVIVAGPQLTDTEIAQIVGLRPKSVRSIRNRALDALRENLRLLSTTHQEHSLEPR